MNLIEIPNYLLFPVSFTKNVDKKYGSKNAPE